MSDDGKIELLKRRKLQEMKRRLLIEKVEAMKAEEEQKEKARAPALKKPSTTDILNTVFINRAWEVWNAAAAQYPQILPEIGRGLASLIQAGKITSKVTGEQLYWFFRRLGLRVRLKTKIRIYESGELKTIADKLREK